MFSTVSLTLFTWDSKHKIENMCFKKCEQFKTIFKNTSSPLNACAVDVRKGGFIEIKTRKNVEAHRDAETLKKKVATSGNNFSTRLSKWWKRLINNTVFGKDSIILMPLMLPNIKKIRIFKNYSKASHECLLTRTPSLAFENWTKDHFTELNWITSGKYWSVWEEKLTK